MPVRHCMATVIVECEIARNRRGVHRSTQWSCCYRFTNSPFDPRLRARELPTQSTLVYSVSVQHSSLAYTFCLAVGGRRCKEAHSKTVTAQGKKKLVLYPRISQCAAMRCVVSCGGYRRRLVIVILRCMRSVVSTVCDARRGACSFSGCPFKYRIAYTATHGRRNNE